MNTNALKGLISNPNHGLPEGIIASSSAGGSKPVLCKPSGEIMEVRMNSSYGLPVAFSRA